MNEIFVNLSAGKEYRSFINRIVVHAMGFKIQHKNGDNLFAWDFLRSQGISAHIFICPNGDIIRGRHDYQTAYHARGYNTNSLGIEFLVDGIFSEYEPFLEAIKTDYLTDAQYKSGVEVCKKWVVDNNIPMISKHSDLSPDRKEDPGLGFPWLTFLEDLKL